MCEKKYNNKMLEKSLNIILYFVRYEIFIVKKIYSNKKNSS